MDDNNTSLPDPKKMRVEEPEQPPRCRHFVERKKRLCKMTVAKGRNYCGEHDTERVANAKEIGNKDLNRIPCPYDPRHTVYEHRFRKHLLICNARPKANPDFIEPNINSGSADEADTEDSGITQKLSALDAGYLAGLVSKINTLYEKLKPDFDIEFNFQEHKALVEDISNPTLGPEALKHLKQTSAILGSMNRLGFIRPKTSFVEFGAGKGQVSFYLAKVISELPESNVLLVDKASHRHKKDNKVEERETVHRIRADIADLKLDSLPQIDKNKDNIIGISKHLCGAATDLTIRCMLNGSKTLNKNFEGALIAVCCHHRCSWRAFVGKKTFTENELNKGDFQVISKLVSWAICGSGMSRERRRLIEERSAPEKPEATNISLSREEREKLGYRCKRIIDFSRVQFLREQQYDAGLFYYIDNTITLENVCIFCYRNKDR